MPSVPAKDVPLGQLSLSTGVLLRRLFHAVPEQSHEFRAGILGLAVKLVEELALPVRDLAVREEHPPQPGGLLGVDPALREDMVLDRLVEEVLEGWCHVLHPLV